MSERTDKKCEICGRGYLVKETWGDFYCNTCYKRPPKKKTSSRSGGISLEEDLDDMENIELDLEEEDLKWYSWPDF